MAAYDFADDDFQLPPEVNTDLPPPNRLQQPLPNRETSPIQIDQEVVIKNKRKPRVKLIDRLLSDRGLTHLQREAPRKLQFKGKGHEKQDLTRLLNYYQLWMHDVFPKARFRDCIVLTEKAGHIAQLRVMRQQWIDDTKPRREEEDLDVVGLEVLQSMEREGMDLEAQGVQDVPADEPLFVDDESDFDMDDILGGSQEQSNTTDAITSGTAVTIEETVKETKPETRDEFEDELDVMNEMDDFF